MEIGRIFDLSPDTLNEIIQLINADDIMQLWLCGSKELNLQLGPRGGVRTLKVVVHRKKNAFVWPSIVAQLSRLEIFGLTNALWTSDTIMFDQVLTLPRTVRRIESEFTGDGEFFHRALTAHPNHFPNLEALVCIGYQSQPPLNDQGTVIWPSTLTEISFFCFNPKQLVLIPSSLPPHLTNLSGSFFRLDESSGKLPSTVTDISIKIKLPCDWVRILPPNLLACVLNGSKESICSWNELPKSITSMTFEVAELTCSIIQALPRGLKRMHVRSSGILSQDEIRHLPPGLESINSEMLPNLIDAATAALLPRSLTNSHGNPDIDAVIHLPQGLKLLTVGWKFAKESKSPEKIFGFSKLPFPALTRFTIIHMSKLIAQVLPNSLTNLRIENGHITNEDVKLFPRNLQYLTLASYYPFNNIECLQYLPPALKDLCCSVTTGNSHIFPVGSSSWFPRSLTKLRIGTIIVQDPDWFKGLPDTLTDLSISFSTITSKDNSIINWSELRPLRNISILAFMFSGCPAFHLGPLLQHLPRSTDSFELAFLGYSQSDSRLVNSDLAHLPPRLSYLLLPAAKNINVDCLDNLPQSLQTLSIHEAIPEWFQTRHQRLLAKRAAKAAN
jgi:hypothetical protein